MEDLVKMELAPEELVGDEHIVIGGVGFVVDEVQNNGRGTVTIKAVSGSGYVLKVQLPEGVKIGVYVVEGGHHAPF